MPTPAPAPAVPRLTYLRIKNYRALRDVEFRDLTPLTVLIGPNGSGKSTVLDALDFLAEAVRGNLVGAWEKRDRFRGMRTRGSDEPIEFIIDIKLVNRTINYMIALEESNGGIIVVSEQISIHNKKDMIPIIYKVNPRNSTLPLRSAVSMNEYASGIFKGYKAQIPNNFLHLFFQQKSRASGASSTAKEMDAPAKELANAITSYRLLHLTDDHLKGYSDAGPREKLSPNGDNLPNVLYYLHTKHPETLARITEKLRRWVPQLADVVPEITSDERLLLRFKDAAFEKPLPAQYMSGGTMRLAALFTLLYEPNATGLLGIEEPDNELHPLLLYRLAEELGVASETRQLLVTTHSPMLLDALDPAQVWILHRGADGYTQATRTADIPNVTELVEDGSPLGYLWTSNAFTVGNPLAPYHPRPDAR